jgi:hypothetical protein
LAPFNRTEDPTMTDEMMSLRALLEKSSDAALLREMIGFTAHRLMELEVAGLTGAGMASAAQNGSLGATATAIATGRPAPAPSNCASPGSERAATSRAFSSRAGWPRRR